MRIASRSRDRTIRVWDASTGEELARLQGHTERVTSVAFSREGEELASRDEKGQVMVWKMATFARVEMIDPADAASRLAEWELPTQPTRLPGLGAVMLQSEAEWRLAWRDRQRDPATHLPRKVIAILDRWERDIGMKVDMETGELVTIPTPGPAYADKPEIAARCK